MYQYRICRVGKVIAVLIPHTVAWLLFRGIGIYPRHRNTIDQSLLIVPSPHMLYITKLHEVLRVIWLLPYLSEHLI